MTLAIGMQCSTGIIIAADTRFSFESSEVVSHGIKATSEKAGEGIYAIAHSSDDANAADSLVAELKEQLRTAVPNSLLGFVAAVKDVMSAWYVPVHDNRPFMQLLVGVMFPSQSKIYLCEPPNTVTPLHDHYKAIGNGWIVTDPIYNAWLRAREPAPVRASLCQLSYLMSKAKQAFPRAIGGATDAVFLETGCQEPLHVDRRYLAIAESYAVHLDHLFSHVARHVTASTFNGDGTLR